METIHCVVRIIKFENLKDGFKVLTVYTDEYGKDVTISGIMPKVVVGTKLIVEGNWGIHHKYGKQFTVNECKIDPVASGIPDKEVEHQVISGSTQNNIRYYFGRALVFDEGLVFSPPYSNVLVWDEGGQICYSVISTRPGNPKYELYFNETHKITEKHAEDVFKGLNYQQLLSVILSDNHKEPKITHGKKLLERLKKAKQSGGKIIEVAQSSQKVVPPVLPPKPTPPATAKKGNISPSVKKRPICISNEFRSEVLEVLEILGGVGHPDTILRKYNELKENKSSKEEIIAALDSSKTIQKDNYGRGNIVYRIKSEPLQKKRTNNTGKAASIAPGNRILVVKKSAFSCLAKGHRIETLLTDIPVIIRGKPSFKTVSIEHCITEDKFFIYEPTFLSELHGKFRKEDVLRTFVYEKKEWGISSEFKDKLADNSPLRLAGYDISPHKSIFESDLVLCSSILQGKQL